MVDTGHMISRRKFITGSVALAVTSSASKELGPESGSILVNDIHSQLNSTRVQAILEPRSVEDVQTIVRTARTDRKLISVAGGRHAMGGSNLVPILCWSLPESSIGCSIWIVSVESWR